MPYMESLGAWKANSNGQCVGLRLMGFGHYVQNPFTYP